MITQEEKTYSAGELAKATGLTVRTLQHYDNIGLLPASGRTEGGRRYYTKRDVLRLTQITIYKSLGFPLSRIREELADEPTSEELIGVFSRQLPILAKKMDDLHMALTVLSTSLNLFGAGKEPPLEILAELIRATEGSGLSDWSYFPFDPELLEEFTEQGLFTLHGAMNFYHTMRELMVEAIALDSVDTEAGSDAAQKLAQDWWEKVIVYMISGNTANAAKMVEVDNSRENWPPADRKLYEMAEPFIEAALAVYMEKNNLTIPLEEVQND